ncbi:MAG: hypothetical protein AAFY71_24280 [Bacteroidota bacterium]
MKQLIVTLLVLLSCTMSFGQNRSDALPIIIEKGILNQDFYKYEGKRMNMFKLNAVLNQDKEASGLNQRANILLFLALPGAFAGGLFLGGAGSNTLYGGEFRYDWLAIGTVLFTSSIYVAVSSDMLRKRAVITYNSNMGFSYDTKPKRLYKLILNGNGIGLGMDF